MGLIPSIILPVLGHVLESHLHPAVCKEQVSVSASGSVSATALPCIQAQSLLPACAILYPCPLASSGWSSLHSNMGNNVLLPMGIQAGACTVG